MKVLMPHDIAMRLATELQRAGTREIGGLLMGEHVQGETFRIVNISVQRHGGTSACFVRDPNDHAGALHAFFEKTGRDYARFNYLGEWHSHPSFQASPSGQDLRAMQEIAEDTHLGVNFAVLLVVRLARENRLETSAMAFRAGTDPTVVDLVAESYDDSGATDSGARKTAFSAAAWILTVLRLLPRKSTRRKKLKDGEDEP